MQSNSRPIRTRFAPSPTGYLHKGHALSALWAARRAERLGGDFLVRIEDIDHTRRRPEMIDDILFVLEWLGLTPAREVINQHERRAIYQAGLEELQRLDVVYPCTCTRADIIAVTGDPSAPYPGTCRSRNVPASANTAWRLRHESFADQDLSWVDLRLGRQDSDLAAWGDVIIARKDIATSYHLAHVIDDHFQQVSHVTRGMDLYTQTPIHRALQQALGFDAPVYDHHPLLMSLEEPHKKLSKRDASTSLMALVEQGLTREELLQELHPLLSQLDRQT